MLLFQFLLSFIVSVVSIKELSYDVFVYKSSPAGITASIAAAEKGKHRVLLVEPLLMIGGMGAAGGLALHDQLLSSLVVVTGLAKEWCIINGEHYYEEGTRKMVHHPEMFVAEASFMKMLRDASVELLIGYHVTSVEKVGEHIASVVITNIATSEQQRVFAPVFIDASYDGDVLVQAGGIDFTWGREDKSVYNESLAGVQVLPNSGESFAGLNISAVYKTNDTIIPYVSPDPLQENGSGDDKLMAFQHRACLTTDQDNLVPFPKPPNYNRNDFLLLQRQIDAVIATGKYPNGPPLGYFTSLGTYAPAVSEIAGRKKYVICCGDAPVNSDQTNINQGWATANHSTKEKIIAAHTYYTQGSLYYLANDKHVPEFTRDDTSRFGLCADEFVEFGNWPPQLYIRASIRLIGSIVLTQNNLANPRSKKDSVAMGCWELDQHIVSRHGIAVNGKDGRRQILAINEGYFRHSINASVPPGDHSQLSPSDLWYDVPFQVMVPKRGQAANLLVACALSTSSVAFTSVRIETMYMDLGTAAGVAARQIVLNPQLKVQDVDIQQVQNILVNVYSQRIHGPFSDSNDINQHESINENLMKENERE